MRDNKSLVIVERQGTYQVSSDDVTKNVYQFSGTENTLKITRVYSTEWLCSYEMINYPFDTQVHIKSRYILRFESTLRGNLQKKRVYLKTLSRQVGGWSRHFQKFFNELFFDIRWGQIHFLYSRSYLF